MVITSSSNKIFKYLVSLTQKKYRFKENAALFEGERLIKQLIAMQVPLKMLILSEDVMATHLTADDTYYLSSALFSKISDTVSSQGVIAVVDLSCIPKITSTDKPIVVLDRVQDPGNLGTILRTAEALGYTDIVMTKGSVDVFNAKTIRASMGAVVGLNITQGLTENELLDLLNEKSYKLFTLALKNAQPLHTAPKSSKCALVFGNEANGVSKFLIEKSDGTFYIPMSGRLESLNVAMSVGIALYEFTK